MSSYLIIVGLSGCGKSTLLKRVEKALPDLTIVNYGRSILSVASAEHLEPDTIRKQPHCVQKDLRLKAAQKILTETKGLTLIDTHCFIKTKAGFMPGVPHEIISLFNPKGLIFVHSDPEDIYQRRLRDKLRSRDKQNYEEIRFHQEMSRSFITACAFFSGAPLKVIHNEEGGLEKASLSLVRFIEYQREEQASS